MTRLKEANWWKKEESGKIICTLCPRYCMLAEGQKGFCYIRENIEGKLYSTGYGKPTGFGVDPIEKKPLFHFLPGSIALSFGTAGCNLGCKFCQNWSISKARIDEIQSQYVSPSDVIKLAKRYGASSIAYTYNEPIIFGEYVIDTSALARENGIKNVMVTNGYVDKEARKDIFKYVDAANVDLKAFSEKFYKKLTLSHLEPVLDTLKWIKNETEIWLEITTLLIPDKNDSDEEILRLVNWILENLGDEVPLHFTAFHPDFMMKDIEPTSPRTLIEARRTALEQGIKFCYVGNVHNSEGETTFCPNCGKALIRRDWHSVYENNLTEGKCNYCGGKISGVF